ncbi:hypothetical protein [Ochrovirga pacifica]|uniref:hypothetical protein n=1 Tax=Ochrovirga pacifica TaxID=1042376 RepID=UPI0002558000|nr:hypothetical protein [Ochrovirga pacifica]
MKYILIIITLFCFQVALGQSNFLGYSNIENSLNQYRSDILDHNKSKLSFNVGAILDLGIRDNSSFRIFTSLSYIKGLVRIDNFHSLIGAQSLVEIFRGGLASSVLDTEKGKFIFEIRNSLMVLSGFHASNKVSGKPVFVGLGNNYNSLLDPLDYSLSLGTTFVNGIGHNRNQQVGIGSISVLNFRLAYYNDGPPYKKIGLGDGYDRYWSGGGSLGLYFKDDHAFFTDYVIRYDNYTGYQSNLYETVDLLKLDNIIYKNKKQQFYNQGRIQYQLNIKNQIRVHYSFYQPYYWDIQKWIHYNMSHNPFHPRPKPRTKTFGVDYNHINLSL